MSLLYTLMHLVMGGNGPYALDTGLITLITLEMGGNKSYVLNWVRVSCIS